jgi:hypothetical protein
VLFALTVVKWRPGVEKYEELGNASRMLSWTFELKRPCHCCAFWPTGP